LGQFAAILGQLAASFCHRYRQRLSRRVRGGAGSGQGPDPADSSAWC